MPRAKKKKQTASEEDISAPKPTEPEKPKRVPSTRPTADGKVRFQLRDGLDYARVTDGSYQKQFSRDDGPFTCSKDEWTAVLDPTGNFERLN